MSSISDSRRVVITGIGVYSCIGQNIKEVTDSLLKGRSGIGIDPVRKKMGYRSALTGIVEEPNLMGMLSRRQRVGMSEQAKYAYVSTMEALAMAGVNQEYLDENVVGILFGNDSSARAVIEAVDIIREKKDTMLVGSGSIFQSMNSTVTMNLATILRLKGINFTVSAACASGSHSIGIGYHLIKSGLEHMVLCGGAQEVNELTFGSFDGLGVFSSREEEPTKASRPFDKDRDGIVTSGGGATLIVESLESALKRGAKILAEIVGYGFSSNGKHISNSDTEGQERSIKMALQMAGIEPSAIDYINAHATSTPGGDIEEARAISNIFGDEVPVSSTKSMTGHECWMAGSSEAIYGLLMLNGNFIAPNINFVDPDMETSKINVIRKTTKTELNCFMSNSFGFGGTNSTLIFKKYE
ncbi:MAG TPA: beta-ketoacyl synthase [Flavobacteriales bacterium]|jgi:3-oxoacyl-[acyl-carrier-protein] synthase-1|nr:beta-ketoacyl synthase [Flavobacteriales bacterium]